MNEQQTPTRLCENEACGRPADPDQKYCDACALERSLYFRDRREEMTEEPPVERRETA